MKKTHFKPDDIVRYTSVFCRNIGMFTEVPIDGKVLRINEDLQYPVVQWHDREEDEAMCVHPGNLELVKAAGHST